MASLKSNVEELYTNWNNDLYQRYIELFPEGEHTTIWDGVVNPVLYSQSPLKIMFLNREGYTEESNDYDLAEALSTAILDEQRIFPNQTTMRTHLKQYLLVLQSMEYGLIKNTSDDKIKEIISQNSSDEKLFNSLFARVAYCNVKKSDGQSNSDINDLKECAQKGLEILKEQIRFFNPSIILGGNVCDGILEDLVEWGENLYVAPDHQIAIWQIKIDDKCYPFVDMYHPSYAGLSEYYIDLLHALQAVEKMKPNFWKERLNQPCFDMNSAITEETPHVMTETNNKAEILFEQAQNAAKNEDWKEAITLYSEAAELNYAPAFREMGRFFEDVFPLLDLEYEDNQFYDKFDHSMETELHLPEAYYYKKAAELGDAEGTLKYSEYKDFYNF